MSKKKRQKTKKVAPVAVQARVENNPLKTVAKPTTASAYQNNLEIALVCFIALLPFFFIPGAQLRMMGIYIFSVFFTVVFFGFVLSGQRKGYLKIPSVPILFWFVVGWLVIRFLAALHGSSFVASTFEYWEGSWSDGLLFSLCQLLLGYSVISLCPSKEFFRNILIVVIPQAIFLGIITIVSAVNLGWPHVLPRADSFLQNTDAYISYSLLTTPLIIGATYLAFRRRFHIVWRVGSAAATLLVLLALYLSLPGALQRILLKVPVEATTTEAHSTGNGVAPVQDFLTDTSNTERFSLWTIGEKIAEENPVLGVGPGLARTQFYAVLGSLNPPVTWNYAGDVEMSYPHNELIEQADTSGFGGLFFFIAFWTALAVIVFRKRKNVISENKLFFYVASISLFLYFGFNIFYFQISLTGIFSVFLIGCLLSMVLTKEYRDVFNWPKLSWPAGVTILIVAAVGFGFAANEVYAQSTLDESTVTADPVTSTQFAVDAAESYPYSAYYQANAADSSYNLAISPPTGMSEADRIALAAHSMTFADAAVKIEPLNPRYYLMQGAAYFLFNANGSPAELKGEASLRKAVALSDHFFNIPLQAAHIAHFKGDLPLTHEFAEDALNMATKEDKPGVQKEVNALLKES